MKKFKSSEFEFKVSEYFIGYKSISKEKIQIKNSSDAEKVLRPYFNEFHGVKEAVFCLYMNRANCVIGVYKVSEGAISSCVVDPRLVLKPAIELLASSMILAHNHPSGQLKASNSDVQITKKVLDGAKLFDIDLVDHLILTDNEVYSLADNGQM
jgi:DNA repair protein RadC